MISSLAFEREGERDQKCEATIVRELRGLGRARAIEGAVAAGRWDVVAQLARAWGRERNSFAGEQSGAAGPFGCTPLHALSAD